MNRYLKFALLATLLATSPGCGRREDKVDHSSYYTTMPERSPAEMALISLAHRSFPDAEYRNEFVSKYDGTVKVCGEVSGAYGNLAYQNYSYDSADGTILLHAGRTDILENCRLGRFKP